MSLEQIEGWQEMVRQGRPLADATQLDLIEQRLDELLDFVRETKAKSERVKERAKTNPFLRPIADLL
jgi:hypothetical protein